MAVVFIIIGVDYQLPISYNITFYPENQSLPVQFKILDDVKLENDEAFTLFTSGPLDISVSTTTTVIILDDESILSKMLHALKCIVCIHFMCRCNT